MSILNIQIGQPGVVGVLPRIVYINTNDTLGTVTTTGYLNHAVQTGYSFSEADMALVITKATPTASTSSVAWLEVQYVAPNWSLTATNAPGSVTLPTITNHIATYTNTLGALSEDPATAISGGNIQAGLATGTAGAFISYASSSGKGSFNFTAVANTGNTVTTLSNAAMAQTSTISIPDPGNAAGRLLIGATATPFVSGNFPKNSGTAGLMVDSGIPVTSLVLTSVAGGQTISASSSSATPGTIRALVGSMTETAAVMTSGNVVGVRGVVNNVGASGGFVYGAQGKIISTGTLSGSSWNAAVFGQFDISAATVNAGQTACIWGDYGTSSGTITSATGMRGIAMTNTTAAVLNAQDYRYGNATYLLELAGAGGTLNYYATAGTSAGSAGDAAHCAAQKVIVVEINGVAAYIPVFTQNT
jgi:hypothetical protein